MEVKASLNYLRISPRKVRLVADLIRGKKVKEAESYLRLLKKRAKEPLLKLLKSAVSNAKNNFNLSPDTLYIAQLRVDEGPALKRWMPRARGSASLIKKRSSHILMVLKEVNSKKSKE
ncbi:MAG: 50S ribosomal protein L22 [Minisyncoccia bacterium]